MTVAGLAVESGGHLQRPIAGGGGATPDYGTALVLRVRRPRDGKKRRRRLQLQRRCVQRGQRVADGLGG